MEDVIEVREASGPGVRGSLFVMELLLLQPDDGLLPTVTDVVDVVVLAVIGSWITEYWANLRSDCGQ